MLDIANIQLHRSVISKRGSERNKKHHVRWQIVPQPTVSNHVLDKSTLILLKKSHPYARTESHNDIKGMSSFPSSKEPIQHAAPTSDMSIDFANVYIIPTTRVLALSKRKVITISHEYSTLGIL